MNLLLPAPKPKMTFVSLFSGVGGFDLGFERAGMTCIGMCEINKQSRQVLNHHWPYVPKREDVTNVTQWTFSNPDVLCGGFPCQDVSVAGRRAGLAGERSGLWFEFHRLIDAVKPKWVVIENVPGLLSSNEGRDFETILTGLVNSGYRVCWRVLDSQYFGVAQRRRRVFIVASLGTGDCAQVLFESESGGGHIEPGGKTGEGTPIHTIKGAAINRKPEASPQYGEITEDQSYTLNATEVHAVCTAHSERMRGFGDYEADAKASSIKARDWKDATDLVAMAIDCRNHRSNGDISGTLQAKENGSYSLNYTNPVAFQWNAAATAGMPIEEDITPTMKASGHTSFAVQQKTYVRRFTPVECERLQGFPDNWTNMDGMSDSVRYRMMGNAVTVNVAEWIGKRIMETNP